jgi:periplasmic protein CpxP/Spy
MKQHFIKIASIAALAGGMALAQTPAPGPAPNPPAAHQNFARQRRERLAQKLNLTEAQKQQAKAIFENARMTAKPVREQLKENRQALVTAAKAGNNNATIQQLAAKQGNLLGKMVAIRTEAFGRFYQLLTPEQRAKAGQMHHQWRQRFESRLHQRYQRSNG